MRAPARVSLTATAVAAAVSVAVSVAVIASFAGAGVSVWTATIGDGPLLDAILSGVAVVSLTVVGAVVVAARPVNPVGWLMLAGGTLGSLGSACVDLAHLGIVVDPGRVPDATTLAVAGSASRAVSWYLVIVGVPLFFPDGRLPPRWRRWLVVLLGLVVTGAAVGPLIDAQADLIGFGAWRNPLAAADPHRVLSGIAFLASAPLGLFATGIAVAQLVERWRTGDAFRRQQLALLALAASFTLAVSPIAFIVGAGWLFSIAVLPLPFAIGFAVLARGLYDLRTGVNRTLVWITLSGAVASLYALVIAGIGGLLHVRGATWLPWVAAAVVAVGFAPLRDGLQRGVNRLTFGRWDEPYDVLAALGQRLEGSADVDRLLADVVAELELLGLHEVCVADEDGRLLAGAPAAPDAVLVPLIAYGRPVGTLCYREPAPPLRPRDRRLLDDLGGHLGGVLHAYLLSRDLQRALEAQVLAREEERRRLRRDLHDGLGPALAGHLLRLDVLAGKLPAWSPAAADADALREDLRATVLEVRRVVEGLRPPALDELGLRGALVQAAARLSAGSGVAVEVRAPELPALPAAVEVAAYRIVTEAVTNVVRHARATACCVAIEVAGALLRITVTDDGSGVDPTAPPTGNGLQTMRERAEELRGRLRVTGGAGTTIEAELPVSEVPPAARQATSVAAR